MLIPEDNDYIAPDTSATSCIKVRIKSAWLHFAQFGYLKRKMIAAASGKLKTIDNHVNNTKLFGSWGY